MLPVRHASEGLSRSDAVAAAMSLHESVHTGAGSGVLERAMLSRIEAKLLTWGELVAAHREVSLDPPPCPVDSTRTIWVVGLSGALPHRRVADSLWEFVPWKLISIDATTRDPLCVQLHPSDERSWPAVFDRLPDRGQ